MCGVLCQTWGWFAYLSKVYALGASGDLRVSECLRWVVGDIKAVCAANAAAHARLSAQTAVAEQGRGKAVISLVFALSLAFSRRSPFSSSPSSSSLSWSWS